MAQDRKPNIVYFHVDNLGYGELGCYGGGILRGAETTRIDQFANEGFKMLNFAPEAQCSPTRAALMTGRHAIRSGNTKATVPGIPGGLTAWERTMGDLFSGAGYATACVGKWHIGEEDGRWPTDHGFDQWYGPPGSYDVAFWPQDPWYVPGRDPEAFMYEGRKGEKVIQKEKITFELKVEQLDLEYNRRAFQFIEENAKAGKPFFLYHNHTLMHMPVAPRAEYKGKSGHGDWADSLLQLDGDFGAMLDKLDELGLRENTIVVFAGDNGNEECLLDRGTAGFWEGSYFTGMEGSLRTPCIVQWPGKIASGVQSNEIMHCVDWFTTLAAMAGVSVPNDREMDSIDQSAWLSGKQKESNREGFLYWNADQLYGAKWRNFKCAIRKQLYLSDPVLTLPTPYVINLDVDPKEREPYNAKYLHTWTIQHFAGLLKAFMASTQREELTKPGSPLDFVPKSTHTPTHEADLHKLST